MIKIAADIICKNEEEYIEYCIDSIVNHVDKIFVTDTGSTDGTFDILYKLKYKYQDKILLYNKEWNNNYSDIHNQVIDEIQSDNKYDYYLRVDADEIYFHSVLDTLKEQLSNNPDQLAWYMPYVNFHGGHRCLDKTAYDKKTNICKLKGHDVKYIGQVHEFIHIDGQHIMEAAKKILNGTFFHHYSWCLMKRRYLKKLERIKSEAKLDNYNGSATQLESIKKFYSQFKECPNFQVRGDYTGPYPEVLQNSWLLENKIYPVDNTMDSKCVKSDEFCEYQCVIDKWETSCSNFNYRKENCL